MQEIWYEDDLVPTLESIDEFTKKAFDHGDEAADQIASQAHGVVRVHAPRWQMVQDAKLLKTAERCNFYQIRLGFEFDIPMKERDARIQFVSATCSAWLWSETTTSVQPRVYDVYPRDLYEGEGREVSVEFGPEVKIGDASGTLGKLTTDARFGRVEPVIVAFLGKGEREPRWELHPGRRPLLGVRNLWLLIEVPKTRSTVRLAVRAEGDIQTRWGPIPVGPKERAMDRRPSVLIQ